MTRAAPRDLNEVVVLGSGMSIRELTPTDIAHLNRARGVIAVNKYAAFFNLVGILPTHIYFVDRFEESSVRFLEHVLRVCRRAKLRGLTFVLERFWSQRLATDPITYLRKWRAIRRDQHPIRMIIHPPRSWRFDFITHHLWTTGGEWATSLNQPLFHFRGSLTTVLNYAAIRFPRTPIRLVGCDFTGGRYFYQDELDKLDFAWADWTTPIVKQQDKHFSAIAHEGTTMFDRFGEVVEHLRAAGCDLVCSTPGSELERRGLVRYEKPTAALGAV